MTYEGTPDTDVRSVEDAITEIKQKVEQLKSGVFTHLNQKSKDRLTEIETLVKECEMSYDMDMQQAVEENENLREILKKAKAMLQAMELPPSRHASFLRFVDAIEDEETGVKTQIVDIKTDNGSGVPMRVAVHPDIDAEGIIPGQRVLMSADGLLTDVLYEFDNVANVKEEAYVEEVLGKDERGRQVMVSFGSGAMQKAVLYLSDNMSDSDIEQGSRVLVDASVGLVLDVLSDDESRKYFVFEKPQTTFDDIGGLEDEVEKIKKNLVWPVVYAEKYKEKGLEPPNGIMLYGPPGVGKTMIAKASVNLLNELLSKELGDENVEGYFIHIGGPELQSKWVGETERQMRQIFEEAGKRASPTTPVIIFFDEIDAMFPRRGSGVSSDVETTNVPQFTSLMDGLEDMGNIIVIGATNRLDRMDPAVIRAGRFDIKLHITHPSEEAARDIFKKHLVAEWGQLHPKYDTDVYVSTETAPNGDESPRTDGDGNIVKHTFNRDPEKVLDYLVGRAVGRMYDENDPRNKFLAVKYEGEYKWTEFGYGDFASGAIIAEIVKKAKMKALQREIEGIEDISGIVAADLFSAIDEEYDEMASPQKIEDLLDWLSLEDKIAYKRIVDYKLFQSKDKDTATSQGESENDLDLDIEPEL